jgi:F-type H+-transporting ATPase subunit b
LQWGNNIMSNQSLSDKLMESILTAETDDFLQLASLAGLDIHRDFSGADLRGVILASADLSDCNFSDTDFSGADLRNAIFKKAILVRADFSGADLSGADLSDADTRGAIFLNATLMNTEFIEELAVSEPQRASAGKEAEKIIADAQMEASEIIREARELAEAEAAKVREAAIAQAEEERNRLLGDLRHQVASLAIAAANKLIGEALDERKQRSLLDEFFSGVKSGNLVRLHLMDVYGQSAQVTSALPLLPEEKEVVRRDVLAQVGAVEVSFQVDPGILGGLLIRVGDKVLDASVAGKLEGLRRHLGV